jgi:curli biogenesis system outer membrane secretion channel CsgG
MLAELNLPAMNAGRMSALLSGLEARFEAAKVANNIESAYAHLLMIADFDNANATYRANIANMRNAVQQRAVKKVTTTEFKNSAQRHDYGSVLSSFITQHLFEKIPNDVRIVERQQYEAIVREQTLSGQAQGLSAVDYLITGSLLESKVDTTEVQGKKIMRVVVGRETIPNPAYTTWLEMSNKERKKVDQPSETISVDKHENITVGITEHRKLGIVSVGYRLVDSESGKILFPDSISKDIEHTDNSTEGVEMGEFVLPFKLANLPSDVEILDKLVRELSEEVGTKLVDLLKDQELKYLEIAETGLADNDCNKAVHAFARASGIQDMKDLDSAATLTSLKSTAINCSI